MLRQTSSVIRRHRRQASISRACDSDGNPDDMAGPARRNLRRHFTTRTFTFRLTAANFFALSLWAGGKVFKPLQYGQQKTVKAGCSTRHDRSLCAFSSVAPCGAAVNIALTMTRCPADRVVVAQAGPGALDRRTGGHTPIDA